MSLADNIILLSYDIIRFYFVYLVSEVDTILFYLSYSITRRVLTSCNNIFYPILGMQNEPSSEERDDEAGGPTAGPSRVNKGG